MAWVLIESVQQRAFGWTMPFSVDGVLLLQTLLVAHNIDIAGRLPLGNILSIGFERGNGIQGIVI